MTAPPYPPNPPPDVKGAPFSVWQTIISQYANSAILTTLITDFADYLDENRNMDAFYDLVWNVDTAQGYGLDVWGRIVGVTRTIQVSAFEYFGFNEANAGLEVVGWNQGPWFSGTPSTSNYNLSDDAFRVLILAKALSNISDGSIPSINQILLNLFPGRGNCFVTDGNDMTMTYDFSALSPPLTTVEIAIVSQTGVLPKPVGVLATIVT